MDFDKLRKVCDTRAALLADDDDLGAIIQISDYVQVFSPDLVRAMLDVCEAADLHLEATGNLATKQNPYDAWRVLQDALAALAAKLK